MVAAYLSIMQRRLGARLAFTVEIPAALGELIVPPGMLITLVENAIKHGIEPSPDGGSIRVAAQRHDADDGPRLILTVADTGRGLTESPGQGIGLANIRERLALLYPGCAALSLEQNVPRGFVARLDLPGDTLSPTQSSPVQP